MKSYQRIKYIIYFYIFIMCIQYIPIEGFGVSNVKVAAMALSPILFILYCPKITKAFIWGILYLLFVYLICQFNSQSFRASTYLYLCGFVVLFITVYGLVYTRQVIGMNDILRFIRILIYAYTTTLIIQQIAIVFGLKSLPIINYISFLGRDIGANSLALEPSHAARILTVAYLVLLRCLEVKEGIKITFNYLWKKERWVTMGFLWCMCTMGSGTAFVGLALLSLYFLRRDYALVALPVILIVIYMGKDIKNSSLQRAYNIVPAVQTMDANAIMSEDGSAAARVLPLINTVSIDLSKRENWIGTGTASKLKKGQSFGIYNEKYRTTTYVGNINQYGIICFIISLGIIFSCCIKNIFSLETVIFILLFGASISNIAYGWGAVLLLMLSRYAQEYGLIYDENNEE